MKADTHYHWGGAVKPIVVRRLLAKHGLQHSLDDVRRRMTVSKDEERTFDRFLKKFNILNKIPWTVDDIIVATDSIVDDLVQQDVKCCEVKFTLNKFGMKSAIDAARAICESLERGRARGVTASPVLAFKYESEREALHQLSALILRDPIAEKITAVDFVGDEACFNPEIYRSICDDWTAAGKIISFHVGESQTGCNVREAIKIGATRISHGIRAAVDDPDVLRLARDRGICFDMALSSNYWTGVVQDMSRHPIREFLAAGCEVTIGTDDPAVLNTTLDEEYRIAKDDVGLCEEEIQVLKANAENRCSYMT